MKNRSRFVLIAVLPLLITACSNYANVPPNDIAMVLTSTGYENKVYTPGQVDIGDTSIGGSKQGNSLVLIQRSGVQVKEQFIGAGGNPDKEDHRCLTADRAPVSLDVRLLFALPDYEKPEGKKDLARIFLLGNPQPVKGASPEGRVLLITAESIYAEQAAQHVRGRIRQICAEYASFDKSFLAFADSGPDSMTHKIERAVAEALQKTNVPLQLVNAFVSNLKPDETVTQAIAAKQAADKRVEAIGTLTDFLSGDPTGARWRVYNMQAIQEIVKIADENGHNTILMDIGPGARLLPLPSK